MKSKKASAKTKKSGLKKYRVGGETGLTPKSAANNAKVLANKKKVEANTRDVEAKKAKLDFKSSLPKNSIERKVDSTAQAMAFNYAVDRLKAGKKVTLSNPKKFPGNESQIKKENKIILNAASQMPKSSKGKVVKYN
jgi:hypothetical protein